MAVHETIGEETIQEHSRASRWWSPKRIRYAGLAAMVGGLVWVVAGVIDVVFNGQTQNPWLVAVEPLLTVLMLIGVVGVHAQYRRSYGQLGLAGVVLAAVGFLLSTIALVEAKWIYDLYLRQPQPEGVGLFLPALLAVYLGLFLLGISLYRTRAVPRARAVVPISVLPGSIAVMALGATLGSGLVAEVVFAIGLVALTGLSLVVLGDTLRSDSE